MFSYTDVSPSVPVVFHTLAISSRNEPLKQVLNWSLRNNWFLPVLGFLTPVDIFVVSVVSVVSAACGVCSANKLCEFVPAALEYV